MKIFCSRCHRLLQRGEKGYCRDCINAMERIKFLKSIGQGMDTFNMTTTGSEAVDKEVQQYRKR